MGKSTPGPDRFSTFVAILIALVTVVGAVGSYRIASILDEAGGADSAGLRALTHWQDSSTKAQILAIGQQFAFAAYKETNSLADSYDDLASANAGSTDLSLYGDAFRSESYHAQSKLDSSAVDRDGNLNIWRFIASHVARDQRDTDMESEPHFVRADVERQLAMWLYATLGLFGVVLILLTLSEAFQNWLRFPFVVAASGIFVGAVLVGLFIELVNLFKPVVP